ncbi:SIS domain-containing protein [SAR116 cluster bacterium]|nr:SIS domain-containing protein [SAR116 cluster bacterium]
MLHSTHMRREIEEIPEVIERLLTQGRPAIIRAAGALQQLDPNLIITVARGSSDHAATYFKYACELLAGVPVASIGPSIASLYNAKLKLAGTAAIGISQSGQSPDIVRMLESAAGQGSLSIAITNDPDAPLASASEHTIPLLAEPEVSVAATKTFLASMVAGLGLVAHWKEDQHLIRALDDLPALLEQAIAIDWAEMMPVITGGPLFILGRGPSLAIANEAALKLKETSQIPAASFSSAEVLHGPISLMNDGFPIIAMIARDAAEDSIAAICDRLAADGASVFATSNNVKAAHRLDFVASGHPLCDSITLIASFYSFGERLARERGANPDLPRHLMKVTETV